jgi:hypothetical protein
LIQLLFELIKKKSEDIALLKEEIEKGLKYLSQVEKLRDECARLSYPTKKDNQLKFIKKQNKTSSDQFDKVNEIINRREETFRSQKSSISKNSSLLFPFLN